VEESVDPLVKTWAEAVKEKRRRSGRRMTELRSALAKYTP